MTLLALALHPCIPSSQGRNLAPNLCAAPSVMWVTGLSRKPKNEDLSFGHSHLMSSADPCRELSLSHLLVSAFPTRQAEIQASLQGSKLSESSSSSV